MNPPTDDSVHTATAAVFAQSPNQNLQFSTPKVDTSPMQESRDIPAPVTAQSYSPSPAHASDNDSIEHVWVQAVRKCMKDSRGNPFEQNNAMGRLRVDYVAKRYGKAIKASED